MENINDIKSCNMMAEISEQPAVFDYLINKYIKDGKADAEFPLNFGEVKFVASGSSYNCARLGQKFLRILQN
jgi:glucosamine 6-phosphate synthetase-like amidotransferase/phosphosugar isomerase protein